VSFKDVTRPRHPWSLAVKKIEKKKGQKKRIMYASYAFILDTSQKLHGYKTTPREAD
jgi:hypothetical protein